MGHKSGNSLKKRASLTLSEIHCAIILHPMIPTLKRKIEKTVVFSFKGGGGIGSNRVLQLRQRLQKTLLDLTKHIRQDPCCPFHEI